MAARCKSALYAKGDVVFHKTDLSTDLYIVNAKVQSGPVRR
jgi:hypothetical protein